MTTFYLVKCISGSGMEMYADSPDGGSPRWWDAIKHRNYMEAVAWRNEHKWNDARIVEIEMSIVKEW